MKDILKKLIEADTSYNKSVTRYLHKTHPDINAPVWQSWLRSSYEKGIILQIAKLKLIDFSSLLVVSC